jgi:hypothetical protein
VRNTELDPDPVAGLVEFAQRHDATVHIHHERFTLLPKGMDVNFEICSGWGNHMAVAEDREYYHQLLSKGVRMGFVGGSDSHRRNPGTCGALTGIFAKELSRTSIVDALRRHRCFATDGSRIVPQLKVAGAFIGESVTSSGTPDVAASISGAKRQAKAIVYRDGTAVYSREFNGGSIQFDWKDEDAKKGEHFYYLEVVEELVPKAFPSNLAPAVGGSAWTSPVWVMLE